MRPIVPLAAFVFGYHVTGEIRGRIFRGRKPLSFDKMAGEDSILEKFRLTR